MDKFDLYRLRLSELQDQIAQILEEIRMFNALVKDAEESDFISRMRVRTIFGCIEANLSHLKASALLLSNDPEKFFTRDEFLALQDLEVRKTDSGTKLRPARLTMKQNVKLATRCFAKAAGIKFDVDFGSAGGANFLEAVEIRDRVIHPKSTGDWRVSKADVAVIDAAWIWFGQQLVTAAPPPASV